MTVLTWSILTRGLDASAAPMTPQVQPDAVLVQTTPLERVLYVDAEGTLFGTTGCQRPGGPVESPALTGQPIAPDTSGIGVWQLAGQQELSVDLVRSTCGEAPVTTAMTVDVPVTWSNAVNFGVSAAGPVCLPVNEGVLCGDLDAGALELAVPVADLLALLPPVAAEVAASDGQLPEGATYARIELRSVLRIEAHDLWFFAGQVRFLHPLGAELPFAAGVVFRWQDGDLTLHLGPGTGALDAAAFIEALSADEDAGLVFAHAGTPTATQVVPGGFGERVYLAPAIGVFAADGRPSLGVINWQRAHQGLSADLALGNVVRVIPSHAGVTLWKPAPNPAGNPQTSVWTLDLDPDGVDHDGDALTHARELLAGSDPLSVDSDGGGVEDGLEVARGTDPTLASDDDPLPPLGHDADWTVSLLHDDDPNVVFVGSPFRFGQRFCGDAACRERLDARIGDLTVPTLSWDGLGVYGFAGLELVERRFDGTERRFGSQTSAGLIVPFPDGFLLGEAGTYTFTTHDGTSRPVDFAAEACDGPCDALLGSSAFDVVGQDPATDDLLVLYRGNEEFITYLWHPDRGLAAVGRNRLMPALGGTMGQLQRCLYTNEGTCLGTYLLVSGLSFPYQVDGRSLQVLRGFRADIDGAPLTPAWQDTFDGYVYPDTGAILHARWVRVEDRIAPGDVLHANSAGRLTLHRIDPSGGALPLFGDTWTPPENPSLFPGVAPARGVGVAPDGRVCLVGTDGTYLELHDPDDRGLPSTIVGPIDLVDAVDCDFDAQGVAHVLATNPPRIELVDLRAASPRIRAIPVGGSGTPHHIRVRADGVDVVASRAEGPLTCVDVASGARTPAYLVGSATAQTPDGTEWMINAQTQVVQVEGDICRTDPTSPVPVTNLELNPAAPYFDLAARPDGRLVAVGFTSHILTPRGDGSYASGLFVPAHGAVATVPGGAWGDPFDEGLVQPDFGDPLPEDSDPPDGDGSRDGGGCCRTANAPISWLLLALAVVSLIARRRRG